LSRGVAKGLPELIDGRIQAVFEITSRCGGPEAMAKSLACRHGAGAFQKRAQNLSGL